MEATYTDNDIFGNFEAGDEKAFEVIFKTYYPRLCRFAMKFINDEDEAKDTVQTCFLRIWERRGADIPKASKALVFTMLRNECLNKLKHRAIVDGYRLANISRGGSEALYNADFLGEFDHRLLYDELMERIDSVLSLLPERTASIFRLSRFEGLKNREIAQQLGLSTTSVENHLAKAVRAIATRLRSEYGKEVILWLTLWLAS